MNANSCLRNEWPEAAGKDPGFAKVGPQERRCIDTLVVGPAGLFGIKIPCLEPLGGSVG